MNLALAARSADGLAEVAAEVEARGVRAVVVPTDVGDPTALETLVQKTEAELGGVSLLVNNAGLEYAAPYAEVPPERITQIIDVNLTAPMLLSRRILPGMIERGEGHICNIASVAGLMGTPYNEPYSATKHGLMGFARGLRLTAQGEGWPIEVSVVCPGFVSEAGMYEDMKDAGGVEAPAVLGTSPADHVAREVLRAIKENRLEVVVNPRPVRPLAMAASVSPRFGDWIAGKTGVIELFKEAARNRSRAS
jgi:short-subunit dehydrogenase